MLSTPRCSPHRCWRQRDPTVAAALDRFRQEQTERVLADPDPARLTHAYRYRRRRPARPDARFRRPGARLRVRVCRPVRVAAAPPSAGEVIQARSTTVDALAALAAERCCDVITYEFENVPVDALRHDRWPTRRFIPPPGRCCTRAGPAAVEKDQFVRTSAFPLPATRRRQRGRPRGSRRRTRAADGRQDAALRLRRQRAVRRSRRRTTWSTAWETLGPAAADRRAWVPFDYEVSVIGARPQPQR